MKKLDIKLGGHPLTGDDLLYLQSAIVEGLYGIIESLGGSAVILSGVDISIVSSTLSWTAGWVYMNGELLKVDAGSNSFVGGWGNSKLYAVETYDTTGDVVYESLTTEHTYVVRKATIDNGAGSVGVLLPNFKRLHNYYSPTSITYSGAWGNSGGLTTYVSLSAMGEVFFTGGFLVGSYNPSTDTVITTLAANYAPAVSRKFVCPAIITTSGTAAKSFVHVEITAAGEVKALGLASGQTAEIYADGIRMFRGV